MNIKRIVYIAISLLLFAFISSFGCGKGEKTAEPKKKATGPVAQAKQQVATPTLAPQPEETPLPPDVKTEAGEEPIRAEPKGPITLPPAPTAAPKELPETKEPAPLATIGEELKPKETPPPGEMMSMPAPSLPPAEEAKIAEAERVAYEPKLVTAKTNIDIILDASGSMAAPFGTTSQTKFDMMRESLYEVIYEMTQQQADFPRNVAIRVFGGKYPASEKKCDDSELLVGMGQPNLGGIRGMLDEVKPQGESPIALSITESVGDFPEDGADRVVVLVSDGVDSCDRNACEATEELEKERAKTVVNVVAFDISPADQEELECIAKKGDGQFFLARNENELRSSLEQAINSSVPYNLKLQAQAGATPIPFGITVFKAGTERVVRKDKSHGTKFVRLEPGSYDILIEYEESPEKKKPSKILKGVEILSTTKVEQAIKFNLGQLTLSAIDSNGKITPTEFIISEADSTTPLAEVATGKEPTTFFITPGSYDIKAEMAESRLEGFALLEKGIEVKAGEATDKIFRFQKGALAIKGITTQKIPIPFLFQAYKTGRADIIVASGALPADGGKVNLTPGSYDLLVIGQDPKMMAIPRTKISNVDIKAAETTDIVAVFEMGLITLSAIDGKGNKLPAEFVVRDKETQIEMAKLESEGGQPVATAIPPGTYDIVAYSLKSQLDPKPSVPLSGIKITTEKPVEKVIQFVLGTLRLRGRNAKEQSIRTKFTIYKAASNELVSQAPTANNWMVFDLAPGTYDALALNVSSTEDPKPMIWLRDMKVEDGKTISHEAIFTAGKLKVIGRGPNNQIIKCGFKIYKYGADTELINGVTGNDWEIFEIEPGSYYLEASYHDERKSVVLKKWINITVGENEVVEEVIRF